MSYALPVVYYFWTVRSDPPPGQCTEDPPTISNAMTAFLEWYEKRYMEGAVRTFWCDGNYEWSDGTVGGKNVTCNSDGEWSTIPFTCNSIVFLFQLRVYCAIHYLYAHNLVTNNGYIFPNAPAPVHEVKIKVICYSSIRICNQHPQSALCIPIHFYYTGPHPDLHQYPLLLNPRHFGEHPMRKNCRKRCDFLSIFIYTLAPFKIFAYSLPK